ncbi:hypothetical protein CF166_13150 [Amycolatopsis sp. KNN50.9b]|nr:hypothetical protein CF166_13150 [Amycolatopsis sp. KNN50.9b]
MGTRRRATDEGNRDSPGRARWIAVRHADDHIHLMAILVSEQTGKRIYPYRDYPRLRAECRTLEHELGLRSTATSDKTATQALSRRERGKADRKGWELTARQQLRRAVSQCAASASSGDEFLRELRREGLNPRTTVGGDGEIRGYTVSLPGDVTADGRPVAFSGSETCRRPDVAEANRPLVNRTSGRPPDRLHRRRPRHARGPPSSGRGGY